MKANIIKNKSLKQSVLDKISNDILIALISADTGITFNTLKRQVALNHQYLTLYNVLLSISKHLDIPLTDLLK